jgi:hypothetical protein
MDQVAEHLSSKCKILSSAGRWCLTPVILTTQEAEIRRIVVQSQPKQRLQETRHRKYPPQKELVEWLKVKALSSVS